MLCLTNLRVGHVVHLVQRLVGGLQLTLHVPHLLVLVCNVRLELCHARLQQMYARLQKRGSLGCRHGAVAHVGVKQRRAHLNHGA